MIKITNRLLALIFGIALLAAGVLVAIEAVATWTNSGFVWIAGNQWLTNFKTTPWSKPLVIAISVGIAILGAILLLLQLRRHPRATFAYKTDDSYSWYMSRRSAEAHLQRRITAETHTGKVRAHLQAGVGRWKLNVKSHSDQSNQQILQQAADKELAALNPPSASRAKVSTRKVKSKAIGA